MSSIQTLLSCFPCNTDQLSVIIPPINFQQHACSFKPVLEICSSYSYVDDLRLQGYNLHSSVKHQHFGETCCSPRTVYILRLSCQDPRIISNYLPLDNGIIPRTPASSTLVLQYQSLITTACSQQRYVTSQVH